MIKRIHTLIAMGIVLIAFAQTRAFAADARPAAAAAAPALSDDAARAQALLERAVAHYAAHGAPAFAAFSRPGEFIDGDLYVYVVGDDGVMQASGGPSLALVGRDVRGLQDSAGKQFIKEMIDGAAAHGAGAVEYRWMNREHRKVERKVAYYRKVADGIVAVGYYIPRAAPQAAKALLAKAVEATKQDQKAAIARFNDINGGFVEDDLYVFVVGLKDHVMYAHGSMPRLIGRNADDLRDAEGAPIIRQMSDIAQAKGKGELRYKWLNPVTNKIERKTTYLQRVGERIVAVGHYAR